MLYGAFLNPHPPKTQQKTKKKKQKKQTNATSHSNISSLKTATEKEWNKMSEEFILKACKTFQRRVDTIIEKKKRKKKKGRPYCVKLLFSV